MTSPTKSHMCFSCQSATSLVRRPIGLAKGKCAWCGRVALGCMVYNVPPTKGNEVKRG